MRIYCRGFIKVCFSAFLLLNVSAGQTSPPQSTGQAGGADFVLTVGGEIERPHKLTLSDLAKLPRQKVKATPHNGKESEYEGVAVGEILKNAGVKFGTELKGKALATYLLVEAADGYRAVFALPEIDPAFTDRVILLADRTDGQPLSVTAGPLQIIIPDEKRHARWVRQVKTFSINRAN